MRYIKNIKTDKIEIQYPHLVNGVWLYLGINDQWIVINEIHYVK